MSPLTTGLVGQTGSPTTTPPGTNAWNLLPGVPWADIVLFLQVTTAVAAALLAYHNRRRLVAYIEFAILRRDFRAGLLSTREANIDIGGASFFRSIDSSNGVTFHDLDDTDRIELQSDEEELLVLVVRYNHLTYFRPFRWWVHFWPPETFRVVAPGDDDDLPRPSETTHHDADALLIDDGPEETGAYDNLAYSPGGGKRFTQLRRGSARFELDNYTSGHNIFMPIWVETPAETDSFEYMDDWDTDRIEHDTVRTHRLRIVFDPPDLPIDPRVKTVEIAFPDDGASEDICSEGE